MNHPFDRIDRFIQDLLDAAERNELPVGFAAGTPQPVRYRVLVDKILAYEKRLRAIEKLRPDALDRFLTREAFLEYARQPGGPGAGRVRVVRPASSENEAEADRVFASLPDLARRNPRFFEAVMAELRRGATPQQLLYVEGQYIRCTEAPRPSYREVAERLGVPEGTLRVGVLRLRAKAQHAILLHLHGSAGVELDEQALAPLRRAWREGRPVDESSLGALRAAHSEHPLWRLYAGIAAFRGGRVDEAELHWVFGLIVAQDAETRAKLLSNLACIDHAAGRADRARTHWVAALGLDPRSPFPLLNLAMYFVETGFVFLWTWALKELAKLRGEPERRRVIDGFLAGCPAFEKISRTTDWRRGPAEWIRELESEGAAPGAGLLLREISRRNSARAGLSPRMRIAA